MAVMKFIKEIFNSIKKQEAYSYESVSFLMFVLYVNLHDYLIGQEFQRVA